VQCKKSFLLNPIIIVLKCLIQVMVEKAREALGVPLNRDLAACLLEMALLLNWKLWEKVVVTLV
jgi:hypothetical protein